jgi:hypothetical protein
LVRTSLSFLAMLRHLRKRRSVIPLDFGGQAVRPLELFSDAAGVDEKLDRDCRTGAPCTTHFSLMFIPDVFVVRFDDTMMPHNECVLAEVLNTFWEIVSDNYWQNLDVNINEFWTDKVFR